MDTRTILAKGTLVRNGSFCVERQLASDDYCNTYLVKNIDFDVLFVMKEFFLREINIRNGLEVTVSTREGQLLFDDQLTKFKKEAKRLSKLNNPFIAKINDLFEENGTAYYIMSYINGKSLAEYLNNMRKPMSEEQTWQILSQLLFALKEMHTIGIFHLDINPNNIILDDYGKPVLIGFGASKLFQLSDIQPYVVTHFTLGYTPAEQVEQNYDKFGPWTDFYALGATLYNIQTLQKPPSLVDLAEGVPFEFPASMSKKMQDLICWMMKLQYKERPCSVSEIEEKFLTPHNYCSECASSMPQAPKSTREFIIDDEPDMPFDIAKPAEDTPTSYSCPAPLPEIDSSNNSSQKQEEVVLHIPKKKGFIKRICSVFSKNEDRVNSAVFAPAKISKGDDMMVQVFIYKDEETDQVVVEAINTDERATKRKSIPLNFKLKKGDEVSIHLGIEHLSLSDNVKSLIWQGRYTSSAFYVSVPKGFDRNSLFCEVTLSVNGLLLGQLQFVVGISDHATEQGSAEVISKLYKKVFISYSHKDTEIANVIAEGYKALGTIDFFYDRYTLSPGELFEKKIFQYIDDCDLFILCWSQNAKASEWVKKERERALSGALAEPPKLRLYPINILPYAAPPEEMINAFHFTDYNSIKDGTGAEQ